MAQTATPAQQQTMSAPRPARWTLTFKLVLVLLALSLPPMLGTAYYNLHSSLDTLLRQQQENLQLLAISLANRLDQLIADTQSIVSILAADDEVVAFLSHSGEDRDRYAASVNVTVQSITAAAAGIAHAYLMDRDGLFVAATNPKVYRKNYAHRQYFQRALAGESFVSDLIFGTTSGEPGIYFSRPVSAASGEILGVALVKLKTEAITNILDELHSHLQGVPLLLDQDGVLIHHPNPALRFRSLMPLSAAQTEAGLEVRGYPVERIDSLGLADVARALAAQPKAGQARFRSPLEQSHQVLGYAAMRGEPWTVGVTKLEAQFVQPLTTLFDQALLSMGAVGLLSLLLAVLLGRATPVWMPSRSHTARNTSSGVLPAPAPRPPTEPSMRLAPAAIAASEFEIPRPRLWWP
jgi:C4-dicarboxylate-specific signal transduction histidine kinase